MNKKILVCGDLVWDTHIARLQFNPGGYHQPHVQSHLENRHGGAWYLSEIIRQAIGAAGARAQKLLVESERVLQEARDKALPAKEIEVRTEAVRSSLAWLVQFDADVHGPVQVAHAEIEEKKGKWNGIAKGFSVWEWYDGKEKPAKARQKKKPASEERKDGGCEYDYKWGEGEALPGTWRIKEFLGCEQARWEDSKACPTIREAPERPDVLVIDDLGLGFASHSACWPACLAEDAQPPGSIIVKATPPFHSPLWKRLLERKWAEHLSVVIAAAALREQGARISRGFSWDQTIQEVKAEFSSGGTAWPFRHCRRVVVLFGSSGAAVFSRLGRSPAEGKSLSETLRFERFVFDPEHVEDTWKADLPGTTFGATSIMTAMLVTDALTSPRPSGHLSVGRGLAAARESHRIGGGHDEKRFHLETGDAKIFKSDPKDRPEKLFRSAFPRELLDDTVLARPTDLPLPEDQTLLTDALGLTTDFLTVAAQDIVRRGHAEALKSVPRLECGDYFTVDREEIERLNSVRNLILNYNESRKDGRPLSIAVFGPPGAGKSFAIKQLSQAMFGKDRAALEFNLSQFESLGALHEGFHEVCDRSVQGQIPFVFWDEFDSTRDGLPLGWLKEFLAPMQDAQFVANGVKHPFGKCVFVFAGGTRSTFQEFDRSGDKADEEFRRVKGPDFVSRLRGFVDIKGPNPTAERGDEVYVIRRALMLRALIQRQYSELIDPVEKTLTISPAVLDAFLRVGGGKADQGYLHGARSMEVIVSLSRLRDCRQFGPSELPAREVLGLHVTPDFLQIVGDRETFHLSPDDVERLAELKHESWLQQKQRPSRRPLPGGGFEDVPGYVRGEERNANLRPPTHPLCKPYKDLSKEEKESNRLPARLAVIRLELLGYRIVPRDQEGRAETVTDDALKVFAQSEHRRWMREKLLEGRACADKTRDDLLLHEDIRPFQELEDSEAKLDRASIQAVLAFLEEHDLVLVEGRKPSRPGSIP